MGNTIGKSGETDKLLVNTGTYSKREAVISYIYNRLSKHLKDHPDLIDYKQLAGDVLKFLKGENATASKADLKNLFEDIKTEASKRFEIKNEADVVSIHKTIIDNLFDEINKQIENDSRPNIPESTSEKTVSIPDGSIFNSSKFDYHRWINGRGRLNSGVYRSGDPGVAATPYGAFQYNFLKIDSDLFKLILTGGVGTYLIIPSLNFEDRYIFGVDPSLLLFLGSTQHLPFGFYLREGFETKSVINAGIHDPIDFDAPLKIGASFGKRFNSDLELVIGAKSLFYLHPRDVQDATSIGLPVYDNTTIFFVGKTPVADIKGAIEFYNNETSILAVLSKSLPLLNGQMTISLSGRASLEGDPVYQPALFLNIGYDFESGKQGVSARTSIDTTYKNANNYYGVNRDSYNNETFDLIQSSFSDKNDQTGAIVGCQHKFYPNGNGDYYECFMPQSENGLICNKKEDGNLSCQTKDGELEYSLNYWKSDETFELYKIDGKPTLENTGSMFKQIFDHEDFESFANGLSGLNFQDKLKMLDLIAHLLYETYDDGGLSSLSGSGSVNSIDYDGMYKEARKVLFDPDDISKTSVCRGFAKFIAHLAGMWGFKAYPVGVSTAKMGHVIVMLREPGRTYKLIDKGNGVESTNSTSMLEALLIFSNNNNLPPQLDFTIYDDNGKYLRKFKTNEGRLLEESTTPESELEKFLEATGI